MSPPIKVLGRIEYSLLVESGSLNRIGALVADMGFRRARILTDENVATLYGHRVREQLEGENVAVDLYALKAGEEHKTLDACRSIYDFLATTRADRRTVILALGGGVVGDVAGFAAATYMRGLPLIQVPTTLLAQVDSSIGGKVAVDLPQGKNLVGAFYDPLLVLMDPDVLSSLPQRELSTGMAEVIKAGIIASPQLFQQSCESAQNVLETMVSTAAGIKADIVSRDPFEHGERMQLNLGHTLGHALEAASGYGQLTHGEAVAIGLVASLRLSRRLNLLIEDFEAALEAGLRRWMLPLRPPTGLSWDRVAQALLLDKKKAGDRIRYVVPVRVGEVRVIERVDLETIQAIYEELL